MIAQKKISPFRVPIMQGAGPEAAIFIAWCLINLFLLATRGISADGEATKYIEQAHLLIRTGHLESSNFRLYFVQIALLAASIRLHVSFAFVIAVQLLFNLIATFCFYKTILRLFKEKKTALAGTLLLLFAYPYQEFNTFLQTESLFYSLTLIVSYYLIRMERLSTKDLLAILSLLAILCVTRPTGLLFLPPVFLHLFFIFFRKMSAAKKVTLLISLGIVFLFILDKALGSGGELDFMLPFRDERIICGVPTLPGFLPIKTSANGNSIYGLAYYILHNPQQFARLAGWRTLAFFGLYRNYYSNRHNLNLICYFSVIHLAVLSSIGYWLKNDIYKFIYFLSTVLMTWLTVILTCDDWHNRFYLNISPFLIILGMPVLSIIFKKATDDR